MTENLRARRVDRYDGQTIWISKQATYELGNYLGGGAAGVVYEATDLSSKRPRALKVLNPIGYKLMPSGPLQRYAVAFRGIPVDPSVQAGNTPMNSKHVWWLVHPNSLQVVGAYQDPRYGGLRELPLPRCIEIWGQDPQVIKSLQGKARTVLVRGVPVKVPHVPRKYVKFVRARRTIYREIAHMCKLGGHVNVLKLYEVLELVHDSKTTLFLALEVATGGELFDRIRLDEGTQEDSARGFFAQLLEGVRYCHDRGVCHRDLKPENLLLTDSPCGGPVLKIADFGLSALMAVETGDDRGGGGGGAVMREEKDNGGGLPTSPAPSSPLPPSPSSGGGGGGGISMRRLRSVVGSPHYVAPEILRVAYATPSTPPSPATATTSSSNSSSSSNSVDYDGTKADVWSMGVILYAMLAGKLPFGKDLLRCPRFRKFKRWRASCAPPPASAAAPNEEECKAEVRYPDWFFSSRCSRPAKSLLTALLEPDPVHRISVAHAQLHPWVDVDGSKRRAMQLAAKRRAGVEQSPSPSLPPPAPVAPTTSDGAPSPAPPLPPPPPPATTPGATTGTAPSPTVVGTLQTRQQTQKHQQQPPVGSGGGGSGEKAGRPRAPSDGGGRDTDDDKRRRLLAHPEGAVVSADDGEWVTPKTAAASSGGSNKDSGSNKDGGSRGGAVDGAGDGDDCVTTTAAAAKDREEEAEKQRQQQQKQQQRQKQQQQKQQQQQQQPQQGQQPATATATAIGIGSDGAIGSGSQPAPTAATSTDTAAAVTAAAAAAATRSSSRGHRRSERHSRGRGRVAQLLGVDTAAAKYTYSPKATSSPPMPFLSHTHPTSASASSAAATDAAMPSALSLGASASTAAASAAGGTAAPATSATAAAATAAGGCAATAALPVSRSLLGAFSRQQQQQQQQQQPTTASFVSTDTTPAVTAVAATTTSAAAAHRNSAFFSSSSAPAAATAAAAAAAAAAASATTGAAAAAATAAAVSAIPQSPRLRALLASPPLTPYAATAIASAAAAAAAAGGVPPPRGSGGAAIFLLPPDDSFSLNPSTDCGGDDGSSSSSSAGAAAPVDAAAAAAAAAAVASAPSESALPPLLQQHSAPCSLPLSLPTSPTAAAAAITDGATAAAAAAAAASPSASSSPSAPASASSERACMTARMQLWQPSSAVQRSTRFSTTMRAREVLSHIADIVRNSPAPLPPRFSHAHPRAHVCWPQFKLDVRSQCGSRLCTVRVFLLRTGVYMVEFCRGDTLDIFTFKRFYEHLCAALGRRVGSAAVQQEHSTQLLDAAITPRRQQTQTQTQPAATQQPPRQQHSQQPPQPRGGSTSIGKDDVAVATSVVDGSHAPSGDERARRRIRRAHTA